MLIQLVLDRPQVILRILAGTPVWVWALLAAFLALGLAQLRDRRASLLRVSLMPVGMTVFSLWGTTAAFAGAPLLAPALGTWLGAATVACLAVAPGGTAARYDAAHRSYALPGSAAPLLLIVAIFLLKYLVGVELRLAPLRLHEPLFALGVAGLYGALSGIFLGRAARLWRLALHARSSPVPA